MKKLGGMFITRAVDKSRQASCLGFTCETKYPDPHRHDQLTPLTIRLRGWVWWTAKRGRGVGFGSPMNGQEIRPREVSGDRFTYETDVTRKALTHKESCLSIMSSLAIS
jgi:hypothetical protein